MSILFARKVSGRRVLLFVIASIQNLARVLGASNSKLWPKICDYAYHFRNWKKPGKKTYGSHVFLCQNVSSRKLYTYKPSTVNWNRNIFSLLLLPLLLISLKFYILTFTYRYVETVSCNKMAIETIWNHGLDNLQLHGKSNIETLVFKISKVRIFRICFPF